MVWIVQPMYITDKCPYYFWMCTKLLLILYIWRHCEEPSDRRILNNHMNKCRWRSSLEMQTSLNSVWCVTQPCDPNSHNASYKKVHLLSHMQELVCTNLLYIKDAHPNGIPVLNYGLISAPVTITNQTVSAQLRPGNWAIGLKNEGWIIFSLVPSQ